MHPQLLGQIFQQILCFPKFLEELIHKNPVNPIIKRKKTFSFGHCPNHLNPKTPKPHKINAEVIY